MADKIRQDRPERGISLRAFTPNAVTALALCVGLSGVRFAFLENWVLAAGAVVLAGILDGLDGRIARLLNAQSRFGAELDSRSEEHTSELQSRENLVCRLLLEKKK